MLESTVTESDSVEIAEDVKQPLLNPDGIQPKALFSTLTSCFPLFSGVITQAVLFLPISCSRIGIIPCVICLIVIAPISYLSCSLWIETMETMIANGWTNRRSYFMIAFPLFGRPFAFITRFSLMNFSVSIITGYLDSVSSMLHIWVKDTTGVSILPIVYSLVFLIVLCFPFCLLKSVKYLRYSGFAIIVVYLYLIIVIAVSVESDFIQNAWEENTKALSSFGFLALFREFPYVTLAFGIQLNLFPVWNNLRNQSMKEIKRISKISVLILLIISSVVSSLACLYFHNSGIGNIFAYFNQEKNVWFIIGKILLMIVMGASVALLILPIRSEIDLTFFKTSQPMTRLRRIVETLVLFLFPLLLSALPTNGLLMPVLSCITGCLIFFILPGICYVRLDGLLYSPDPQNRDGVFFWIKKGNWNDARRIIAFVVFFLGILFLIISLFAIFALSKQKPSEGSSSEASNSESSVVI